MFVLLLIFMHSLTVLVWIGMLPSIGVLELAVGWSGLLGVFCLVLVVLVLVLVALVVVVSAARRPPWTCNADVALCVCSC